MIQVVGIPMGSDPAADFANLFLAKKEANWLRHNVSLKQSIFKNQ